MKSAFVFVWIKKKMACQQLDSKILIVLCFYSRAQVEI